MWTMSRWKTHIKPILRSPHWLPVYLRIDFNVLLLVLKALMVLGHPIYWICFSPQGSSRKALLLVARVRITTYGEASFPYLRPLLWDCLPKDLGTADNLDIFKSKLKNYLLLFDMLYLLLFYFNFSNPYIIGLSLYSCSGWNLSLNYSFSSSN